MSILFHSAAKLYPQYEFIVEIKLVVKQRLGKVCEFISFLKASNMTEFFVYVYTKNIILSKSNQTQMTKEQQRHQVTGIIVIFGVLRPAS